MIRRLLAAVLAATPISAMAQPKTASIEARLERVEANLAIRKIIVDYAADFDNRDFASYVALFAPDGEWTNENGSYKGQAAIRGMLEHTVGNASAGKPNMANYHIVSNPRIDVDGDHATATSNFLFMMRGPEGQPTPTLAGTYHDEFVRLNGVWKIKRRVASNIMPTQDEWQKIMAQRAGK